MERREFYSKKWKLAGWLGASVAFVALGSLEARNSSGLEQAGGWLFAVLSGLGAAYFINELLRSAPRLVLSGEGLFDRSLGTSVIPWPSIIEMDTTKVKQSRYVTLQIADEPQRVAELSVQRRALASWNKMLGGGVFNLSLSALDAPPDEVVDAIVKYKDHYAAKR